MKTIKKIYVFFLNFRKKRFIRKELQKKFKKLNGSVGTGNTLFGISEYSKTRNNKKLKILTEAIFKSAKIVESDIFQSKDRDQKYNDEKLFNDLKNVIVKHYSDKETELVKKLKEKLIELETDIRRKNIENSKIKNKISKVIKV